MKMKVAIGISLLSAFASGEATTTVYFVRHAETTTSTTVLGPAQSSYSDIAWINGTLNFTEGPPPEPSIGTSMEQVCGTVKNCARELTDLGLLRAQLLADWMGEKGIAPELNHVISTHKHRTYQTVSPTASAAGIAVEQYPVNATELDPDGTSSSVCPIVDAIRESRATGSSTILVVGHTGTLYPMMGEGNDDCEGLGVDTSDATDFPRDERERVPSDQFGNVWKIEIDDEGVAILVEKTALSFMLSSSTDEVEVPTSPADRVCVSFGVIQGTMIIVALNMLFVTML